MIGAAEYFKLDKTGNIKLETCYYIRKKAFDVENFVKVISRHWRIENEVQCLFDVAMRAGRD